MAKPWPDGAETLVVEVQGQNRAFFREIAESLLSSFSSMTTPRSSGRFGGTEITKMSGTPALNPHELDLLLSKQKAHHWAGERTRYSWLRANQLASSVLCTRWEAFWLAQ